MPFPGYKIEEILNIHDIIPPKFLHEIIDENIQDYYFQIAKHLYAPGKTSFWLAARPAGY